MERLCIRIILMAFMANALGPFPAQADEFILPTPGTMVHLSPAFNPPILKGIKVNPQNPFTFEFILDKGSSEATSERLLAKESVKLIKYFLASLTIPEKDLWVNLSPYEKDRIVPEAFGQTEMGRDLLAQDYMLKQITASLIYPEDTVGKRFWARVYEESVKKFGRTAVPVNTFNKVWIMPKRAVVFENVQSGVAYVVESKLGVLLEQDYLSLRKSSRASAWKRQTTQAMASLGAAIVREIVLPQLEIEVNEGRNFSRLRQVYNSLILATWYKKRVKDSIFEGGYIGRNKVAGVNISDPHEQQRIYEQYLKAFKRGAYSIIKEEQDPGTRVRIPRKYFSGGADCTNVSMKDVFITTQSVEDMGVFKGDRAMIVTARVSPERVIPAKSNSSLDKPRTPAEVGRIRDQLRQILEVSKTQEPDPLEVLHLYQQGANEEDVLHAASQQNEKYSYPFTEDTRISFEHVLPYFDQIYEEVQSKYAGRVLLFAGRDARPLYTYFKIKDSLAGRKSRVFLFPASMNFLHSFLDLVRKREEGSGRTNPSNAYLEYRARIDSFLVSQDISEDAIGRGQEYLILDTGFAGSSIAAIRNIVGTYYGMAQEDVDRLFLGYLVKYYFVGQNGIEQAHLIPIADDVINHENFPLRLARKISDDFNWYIASLLQMFPKYHGPYANFEMNEAGRLIAVPDEDQKFEDAAGNNPLGINPAAALILELEIARRLSRVQPISGVVADGAMAASGSDGTIKTGNASLRAQESNTGGIDLASDKYLFFQNGGGSLRLKIDAAVLGNLQTVSGFTPVIVKMQSLRDVPAFLNINSVSHK